MVSWDHRTGRGGILNSVDAIQAALDFIDEHLKEPLSPARVARAAGYSVYHFARLFAGATGMPVMAYVTCRRLAFARYDLARGGKVIDAAMEYGFDTHAGFTKAFKRRFGYPPSLCFLRAHPLPPGRMTPDALKRQNIGGSDMNPHIMELTPFSAVGYPSRHRKEYAKDTINAPAFWETTEIDYGAILTKLYDAFPKSKHFEITMCYDVSESTGEFSYMVGRGIDNPADLANIQSDMTRIDIAGGLYAIFSTPPAEGSLQSQTVHDTWNDIFLHWLPQSEFEYDETRQDFGYHDHREHGWYFGGKEQIDICIPIRQKEAEVRASRLRLSCKTD
jgi:AraC family transcriptional regulator